MNVLVTGVSRGIGKAVMEYFLKKGHTCIGLTRSKVRVQNQSDRGLITIDWDDIGSIEKRLDELLNGQKVDVLINNAASIVVRPLDELEEDDFLDQFRTNALKPFMLTRFLLEADMLSPKAHVVNIGSMAGYQGSSKFGGLGAYSISKAAIASLTECMAAEWGERISVNCLCLGAVNTEMLNQAFPGYVSEINDVQMASFICEFALNSGELVNGQVIPVKKSDPN